MAHLRSLGSSEQMLQSGEGVLVVFYAPWCKHCKAIVPEVKKAAEILKLDGLRVAAINSETSPSAVQQLGITGYPTIAWLQLKDETLMIAGHQGEGDATSLVQFGRAASKTVQEKASASIDDEMTAVAGANGADDATKSASHAPTDANDGTEDGVAGEAEASSEAGNGAGATVQTKLGMSKLRKSKDEQSSSSNNADVGIEKAKMPASA